jgi:uncharacterized membrane protein
MFAPLQFLNPMRWIRFFVILVFWLAVTAVATVASGQPQTVAGLSAVLPFVTFAAVCWHMAYAHSVTHISSSD